jgi:hypothetical protein
MESKDKNHCVAASLPIFGQTKTLTLSNSPTQNILSSISIHFVLISRIIFSSLLEAKAEPITGNSNDIDYPPPEKQF